MAAVLLLRALVGVTVAGARSVVARAGVTAVAIAAAVIAAIDRRPDERRQLLDDAANLIGAGGGRLCLRGRMRPRGDLVVGQARRGVRLQACKQRAVDRHLTAAAAALVVLLRGGNGGRTGLAVSRPRIEAERDQLILDFAHIVVAERKRGKICIGLLPRDGHRLGGGRRIVLRRAGLRGRWRR